MARRSFSTLVFLRLPNFHIRVKGAKARKNLQPQPTSDMTSTRLLFLAAFVSAQFFGNIAPAQETPKNGGDFHSAKDIIDLIPHPMVMRLKVASQMEAAKGEANAILEKGARTKTATLKVKAVRWEPWDAPGEVPSKFRLQPLDQTINVNGTAIGVRMWIYLPAEAGPALAKVFRGSELTITGFLNRADFTTNKGEGLKLNLDITRTKIE